MKYRRWFIIFLACIILVSPFYVLYAQSTDNNECANMRPMCDCGIYSLKECTNMGYCSFGSLDREDRKEKAIYINNLVFDYLDEKGLLDIEVTRLYTLREKLKAEHESMQHLFFVTDGERFVNGYNTKRPDFIKYYLLKLITTYISLYIGDGCFVGQLQLDQMSTEEHEAVCGNNPVSCQVIG